jgi:prepilin-type N-terminal cleavage/methylation domain-containing protein/prepilin-type processing-associated H-X9-DG protein
MQSGRLPRCNGGPYAALPRNAFTLIELLVVVMIVAILLGVLLPAVMHAREMANRTSCRNNLKQLGLALHMYHDAHATLPPGSKGEGPVPRWRSTWLDRLLPFIEQPALYANFLQSQHYPLPDSPLDSSTAHEGLHTIVPTFACPSDARVFSLYQNWRGQSVALTSYVGVQGVNRTKQDGILFLRSAVRLADITDGASNTLAVGERPPALPPDQLPWGVWYTASGAAKFDTGAVFLGVREPCDGIEFFPHPCPDSQVSEFGPGTTPNPQDGWHFWSLHSGGAHFAFADGAVHYLTYDAAPVMPALASRAGGGNRNAPRRLITSVGTRNYAGNHVVMVAEIAEMGSCFGRQAIPRIVRFLRW